MGKERNLPVLALSFAYVGGLLLAGSAPGSWSWGFNLLAFLEPVQRGVVLGILSIAIAMLILAFVAPERRLGLPTGLWSGSEGRGALWIALLVGGFATLTWLFRDRSHLLGDGLIWINNMLAGRRPLYSEPLAAAAWYGFASLPELFGYELNASWLSILPVLAGAVCALLYWGISGEITHEPKSRTTILLLFLTLGSTQLYCGYVEGYPIVSVFILAYLLFLLKAAHGSVPIAQVGFALAAAMSSHLVALYLAPSYLVLVFSQRPQAWRGAFLSVLPFGVAAAALFLLGYRFSEALDPVRLVAGAAEPLDSTLRFRSSLIPTVSDLANLAILLLPVPVLVCMARLFGRGTQWKGRQPTTTLLLSAALSGLLAAAGLGALVSPAHDWDLLAITLLPAAVAVSAVAGLHLAGCSQALRAGMILIAGAATGSFLSVNASESSAVDRYASLLADDMRLSPHERAYGNERLVMTYARRGDHESALIYARRALDADSANARYWGNVGSTLYNLGRYRESIHYFQSAARLDSSRADAFYSLAQALMREGRSQEAVAQLRRLIALHGESPAFLFSLGYAQIQSGEWEDGRRVWEDLLLKWPDDRRTREAYAHYFGAGGGK